MSKPPVKQHGFTIVELLIVIVVIAILAAITIVAYTGIQGRAIAASLSSDLGNATKSLKLFQVDNSTFPTTIDCSIADSTVNKCVKSTSGTTYQYTVSNSPTPSTFCITATKGTTSYSITQDSAPTSGGCAGHGVGGMAAVTNLIANPSFENDTSGWNIVVNGAAITRQTASVIGFGTYGVRVVPGANNSDSGIRYSSTLTAGKMYTFSASVRAIVAGRYVLSTQDIAGAGWTSNVSRNMAAGEVYRFSQTWVAGATGGVALYILRPGASGPSQNSFDVDGMMLVEGTNGNYADGSSPNWIWNGTANASTSTGPPL